MYAEDICTRVLRSMLTSPVLAYMGLPLQIFGKVRQSVQT